MTETEQKNESNKNEKCWLPFYVVITSSFLFIQAEYYNSVLVF